MRCRERGENRDSPPCPHAAAPSGQSRGKRYRAFPSLTVGVRSEIPRGNRKMTPNPDCQGGDVLTVWRRQASRDRVGGPGYRALGVAR
jgi:hypothetical protein